MIKEIEKAVDETLDSMGKGAQKIVDEIRSLLGKKQLEPVPVPVPSKGTPREHARDKEEG